MLSIDRVLGNTHCVLAWVPCSLWHCHSAFLGPSRIAVSMLFTITGYATQVSAKGHWRRNVGPFSRWRKAPLHRLCCCESIGLGETMVCSCIISRQSILAGTRSRVAKRR